MGFKRRTPIYLQSDFTKDLHLKFMKLIMNFIRAVSGRLTLFSMRHFFLKKKIEIISFRDLRLETRKLLTDTLFFTFQNKMIFFFNKLNKSRKICGHEALCQGI